MNRSCLVTMMLLDAPIVMAAILAWTQHLLTKEQMLRYYGSASVGLPFLNHGGLIGDILWLSPAIAFVIDRYADQWSMPQIIITSAVGILAAMAMHGLYSSGNGGSNTVIDCLTLPGGIRPQGVSYVMYMACVMTVVQLFFLCTANVPLSHILLVTGILAVHMAVGVLQPTWYVYHKLNTTVITTAVTAWGGLTIGAIWSYFQLTFLIFRR